MVTLKASHIVKPAGETPSGNMYLSENDHLLPITHTFLIYVYKSPAVSNLSLSSITHLLTTSLSKALTIFHPLAGRLESSSRNRLKLNLNSAGAIFIAAESTKKVEDFGDFRPNSSVGELIPQLDYTRPLHETPLLVAQITKFSCGGVVIGIGFQHTICDGQAVFHFMSEWARISRGELPENLPFLDRNVLNIGGEVDPSLGFELDSPPVLIDGPDPDEERMKETTVVILKLRKDQIEILLKMANQGREVGDYYGKLFTRYEALTSHLWRCITMARNLKDEQPTRLRIVFNIRQKINPPLSENYFGNGLIVVAIDATTTDFLLQPLGYIAGKVRTGIKKVNDEYVKDYISRLRNVDDFDKLTYFHVVGSTRGAFLGNPNVSITSWIGLTNDGVDFGWGKEIYMGPALVAFDGKAFIFPQFANVDGSLRIALRLRTTHMDTFKSLFYENLSTVSRL